MDVPRITYYAKVIDNLTNNDITNYKLAMDNALWYYGKVDSALGGESQFMVEFDIWNNEPSFNHRTYDVHCANAKNVKLGIEFRKPRQKNDDEFVSSAFDNEFFYARSLTEGYNEFTPITKSNKLSVVGNVNPSQCMLLGEGDHCVVQTKIKLQPNTAVENKRYNFNVTLSYDFE